LSELVRDYNGVAGSQLIDPGILGVVFTMIQFAGHVPIIAVRNYVTHTEQYEVAVFRQMIRESKTLFASAGERGVPAVLLSNANPNVQHELKELATEFLTRIMIEGAT
jgi:chromosome partitioning protein